MNLLNISLIRFLSVFILLSLYSSLSIAQSGTSEEKKRFYDIEVVIFKNIKTPKSEESIRPILAPSPKSAHIPLFDVSKGQKLPYNFAIPSNSEKRLKNVAAHIKRSSRYELLTHKVWRQQGLSKKQAIPILIRTGKIFDENYSSIDAPVSLNNNISAKPNSNQSALEDKKVWYELDGTITVSLARYLHAYVDLVLRVPSTNEIVVDDAINQENTLEKIDSNEESISTTTLNNFQLKEHRRMRSKKLHYLDHPEFGMLILMTQFIPTKETTE